MKYIKINQNQTAIEITEEEYKKLRKQTEFIFETNEVWIIDLYRDQVKPMIESTIIEKNGKSKIARMFHINMLIMWLLALIWVISFIFTLSNKPQITNKKLEKTLQTLKYQQKTNENNNQNDYINTSNNSNNANNASNTGNDIKK